MPVLISFCSVVVTALMVLAAGRVPSSPASPASPSLALAWIGFFVLCTGQIVAVMTAAGLLGYLFKTAVASLHVVTLSAASIVCLSPLRSLSYNSAHSWAGDARRFASQVRSRVRECPIWLQMFLSSVVAAYSVTLLLALLAPPSIQDAMTYYLGRVGFWLQQQSLAFFPTNNPRQTTFPPNASLLFGWIILLTGGDSLVQLVQWVSALTGATAVYALARQLGAAARPSVFSALLWASAPIVVLESSSVQIDLLTTAQVMAGCVFSVEYLRYGQSTRLLIAALAIGLAIGSKFTALILVPGAIVVAAALAIRGWLRGDRRPLVLAASALAAVVYLGSYVYPQSWWNYGSAQSARTAYNTEPIDLFRSLAINGARYSYQLFDTSGLPGPLRRRAEVLKYRIGSLVFAGHVEELLSDDLLMGGGKAPFRRVFTPTLTAVQIVHPDRVGMGLLGPVLVLLLLGAVAVRPRRFDSGLALALGTLFVSFCVSLCVVAGYHYYAVRYNATAFALLAPFASLLYFDDGRRRFIAAAVAALAVLQCWTVLLVNENRPFLSHRPWWSYDEIALATISHPENDGILRQLKQSVPDDATIGVATHSSGWIYPFFGPHFTRRVLNLAVDDSLENAAAFESLGIDYFYVQRRRAAVLASATRQPWLSLIWQDDLGALFAVGTG